MLKLFFFSFLEGFTTIIKIIYGVEEASNLIIMSQAVNEGIIVRVTIKPKRDS